MFDPVFTIDNECQDCYKCVRHCHCKAIRIVDGHASVIRESCVACGECVKICPAHAKKIRTDLARLKQLLKSGKNVHASIAPSFAAYFTGISLEQLSSALRKLGFSGVSETALGAQRVSVQTAEFLKSPDLPLAISSACPACVDYIQKYHPDFTKNIVPLYSPILAHCRMIKEQFGEDTAVVFLGPCAAKKNEADRHPDLLNLAVTFSALEEFFNEKGIDPAEEEADKLFDDPAEEGRFYAIEGGMNDTLRSESQNVRYLSVSGLVNLDRLLSGATLKNTGSRTIFVEALACPGGCINGPVIGSNSNAMDVIMATDKISSLQNSLNRPAGEMLFEKPAARPQNPSQPTAQEISSALHRVGKYTREDELNCGACGYNTCREFARALLEHKAEEAMCHTYLRKNFERTSNALIRFIPAGVVIVNDQLRVTECNRNFAKMTELDDVFDTLGNLNTFDIKDLLPDFSDIFASVIENGGEISKINQKFKDRIVNISVFTIARDKSAGAVIQDVTKNELQRELVAEKAREVIRKNVLTVQQVARLFGEHVADTEILLNEIAGVYEPRRGNK